MYKAHSYQEEEEAEQGGYNILILTEITAQTINFYEFQNRR